MVNIFSHQGNGNQDHHEVPLHTHWNGYYSNKQKISVGEDTEKLESSCTAGRNVNGTLENNLTVPQPSNSTPSFNTPNYWKYMSPQILVHEYSQQYYS